MGLYLISYDLHNRRDYRDLYALLEGWRAVRLHESLWFAELVGPAETINGFVLNTLDYDDSSAVIEIKAGAQWAVMRGQPAGVTWLRSHFPAAY